jgi:hypothetical protein
MTASEIMSFDKYGPYKTFKNGNPETFKAPFWGKDENAQFFLDKTGRLERIGVFVYEGPDLDEAASEWFRAYEGLKRDHGSVELSWLQDTSAASDPVELTKAARTTVETKGKIQMAPVAQPADRRVFSSFWRNDIEGQRTYYVTVNFDRP